MSTEMDNRYTWTNKYIVGHTYSDTLWPVRLCTGQKYIDAVEPKSIKFDQFTLIHLNQYVRQTDITDLSQWVGQAYIGTLKPKSWSNL